MATCELKFDKDVPGIYEGSEVEILDGQAAVEAMSGNNELYHSAFLATIYHPQCPHCHTMHDDFVKLAHTVKEQQAPVKIVATNASKFQRADIDSLNFRGVPAIRYYTGPGKYVEF